MRIEFDNVCCRSAEELLHIMEIEKLPTVKITTYWMGMQTTTMTMTQEDVKEWIKLNNEA